MGDLITNFALAHKDLFIGLAVGAIITHPAALAVGLFNAVVKLPGVGSYIAKNPEKAKAFADQFDQAIDDAIQKYAAQTNNGNQAPKA